MCSDADRTMDLADASLVVMAEKSQCGRNVTIDRVAFNAYRFRQGHRHRLFEILM